jgi:hypothetical protein
MKTSITCTTLRMSWMARRLCLASKSPSWRGSARVRQWSGQAWMMGPEKGGPDQIWKDGARGRGSQSIHAWESGLLAGMMLLRHAPAWTRRLSRKRCAWAEVFAYTCLVLQRPDGMCSGRQCDPARVSMCPAQVENHESSMFCFCARTLPSGSGPPHYRKPCVNIVTLQY